jgi:hypothetical protein
MSGIASFTDTAALSERALRDASRPVPEKKKRVVVTGGSGKLGRWVVREMVNHGWEVYNSKYRGRFVEPVWDPDGTGLDHRRRLTTSRCCRAR